jgi:AAA ATPase-like protein
MEEGMIQASDAHDQPPLPAHASACGDTQTGGLVAGISNGDGGPALPGRIRECHVLDRLLESVRAGQNGVLVLRGESGVGKSALLKYLVGRASGCREARAAGAPSKMAFVAHRLLAESIGLVFAVHEPSEAREFSRLPELSLRGLSERDARALLGSVLPGRLDERVRDRVVSESRGNPLSLLALARGLALTELAGGFALTDVMPLVNRIEQSFARRLESMPALIRRLLLIAAEPQPTPGRGRYGSMRVPSRALRVT